MGVEGAILTVINEGWHIILGFIAFVIGYTKLHLKAEQNTKDNQETRAMVVKGDTDNKVAMQELEVRLNRQRAEDLGRVESVMKEVREDIKTLLQRH